MKLNKKYEKNHNNSSNSNKKIKKMQKGKKKLKPMSFTNHVCAAKCTDQDTRQLADVHTG